MCSIGGGLTSDESSLWSQGLSSLALSETLILSSAAKWQRARTYMPTN